MLCMPRPVHLTTRICSFRRNGRLWFRMSPSTSTKRGVAADKITPTLTLVDHTKTSSWDDFAQGFRADGVTPNMNCPGQSTADLFYFTLYNQPNYLNTYNAAHGGPPAQSLPNNSQFKCYDGMHNWTQVQPAPYDGMYKFPSVTATDAKRKADLGRNQLHDLHRKYRCTGF